MPEKPLLKPKRNVMEEDIDPTSRAAQYKRLVERFSRQSKRKKEKDCGDAVFKRIRKEVSPKESAKAIPEREEVEFKKPHPKPAKEPKPTEPVAGTLKRTEEPKPRSRKEELLKKAPKKNFDLDLYHWEDEKLETAVQVRKS